MLRVHVIFHKDGDFLDVVESPWWLDSYEWIVNRICPCCGLTGKLLGNTEWLGGLLYRIWNRMAGWPTKFEKSLYKTPVDGCIASQAIFESTSGCWRDDCENCWHLREDAYNSNV